MESLFRESDTGINGFTDFVSCEFRDLSAVVAKRDIWGRGGCDGDECGDVWTRLI